MLPKGVSLRDKQTKKGNIALIFLTQGLKSHVMWTGKENTFPKGVTTTKACVDRILDTKE
jgi:hypothetical protein